MPDGIRQALSRRWVLIVYSAFGDESHDESKQRVFTVSGLFGTEEDWGALEREWVPRMDGKIFHAAACESDAEDFAGIEHTDNLRLYRDLTTILCKTKLFGYTVSMNLSDFHSVFPEALDPYDPYFFCFSEVIFYLVTIAHLSIRQDKVKFTFHHNLETDYNAAALYDYMLHLPECQAIEYLADEIAFGYQANPRIQAADLVAREGMKHMDNQLAPNRRPPRRSYEALRSSTHFHFPQLVRGNFEQLRKKAGEMRDHPGAKMSEYRAWIASNKYMDNRSNRIRYQMHLDALLRLQSKAESQ